MNRTFWEYYSLGGMLFALFFTVFFAFISPPIAGVFLLGAFFCALTYQRIRVGDTVTIKIPRELAAKLNWRVGDELWVEIYDEDLSQAIIGKKLKGAEAKRVAEKLGEITSVEA